MKKIYVLRKPMIYTNMDGTNPRENYWGKFLRYGWKDETDTIFYPIFSSLWPGLWISNKKVETNVGEPYWWEWFEYVLRLIIGKMKTFVHYQKLSIKSLF